MIEFRHTHDALSGGLTVEAFVRVDRVTLITVSEFLPYLKLEDPRRLVIIPEAEERVGHMLQEMLDARSRG